MSEGCTELKIPAELRRLGSRLYEERGRGTHALGALSKRTPPSPDATDPDSWLIRAAHFAFYRERIMGSLGTVRGVITGKWQQLNGVSRQDESWGEVRQKICQSSGIDSRIKDLKDWEAVHSSLYESGLYLKSKTTSALRRGDLWLHDQFLKEFGIRSIDYMRSLDQKSEVTLLDWLKRKGHIYVDSRKSGSHSQPELRLINAARRKNPEFDEAIRNAKITYWGDSQELQGAASVLYPIWQSYEHSPSFDLSFLQPPRQDGEDLWRFQSAMSKEREPPPHIGALLCPRPPVKPERSTVQDSVRNTPTGVAQQDHSPSSAPPTAWSVRPTRVETLNEHQRRLLNEIKDASLPASSNGPGPIAEGLPNGEPSTRADSVQQSSLRSYENCSALLSVFSQCQNAKATTSSMKSQAGTIARAAASGGDDQETASLRLHRYGLQRDSEICLADARADLMTMLHQAGYSLPWRESEERCMEAVDEMINRLGAPQPSMTGSSQDLLSYIEGKLLSCGCSKHTFDG